jgi:HPt (histidine-containing phosphotransfer) domain-containing protein
MNKYQYNIVRIDKDIELLAKEFIKNRKNDIKLIEKNIANKNLAEITNIAHKIKGTSGCYGFDELSIIGNKLGKAASKGNLSEVIVFVKQLADFIKYLKIEFN